MNITTSYFSKLKLIKCPISISGKAPQFYNGPEYKKLAPRYNFFMDWKNGIINNDQYIERFKHEVLSHMDINQVLSDFEIIYPGSNEITLICYEKPGYFCHRHIVAEWFNSAGMCVSEKTF